MKADAAHKFLDGLEYTPDELDRNITLLGRFLESQNASETVFWVLAKAVCFKTAMEFKKKNPEINQMSLADELSRKIPPPGDLFQLEDFFEHLLTQGRAR
jgi:hypothetical protein